MADSKKAFYSKQRSSAQSKADAGDAGSQKTANKIAGKLGKKPYAEVGADPEQVNRGALGLVGLRGLGKLGALGKVGKAAKGASAGRKALGAGRAVEASSPTSLVKVGARSAMKTGKTVSSKTRFTPAAAKAAGRGVTTKTTATTRGLEAGNKSMKSKNAKYSKKAA